MKTPWGLTAVIVAVIMSTSAPALADGAAKFPGRGSIEAYRRALGPANRAYELVQRGDFSAAAGLYRKAISIYPYDSKSYHNLGVCLEELGKLDEARKAQEKAIELEPNKLSAWLSLGEEYELDNKFKDAERCYRRAVQIDPSNFNAVFDLGDILRQQGIFEEGKKWFLQAKTCPDCNGARIVKVEGKIAQCNKKDTTATPIPVFFQQHRDSVLNKK